MYFCWLVIEFFMLFCSIVAICTNLPSAPTCHLHQPANIASNCQYFVPMTFANSLRSQKPSNPYMNHLRTVCIFESVFIYPDSSVTSPPIVCTRSTKYISLKQHFKGNKRLQKLHNCEIESRVVEIWFNCSLINFVVFDQVLM